MKLSINDVEKIANLAQLALDADDLTQYQHDLGNILTFIEQLQDVDTTGVTAMAHPLHATQRLRDDSVTEIDNRETLLALAPQTEAGLYLVPKVLSDDQ